MRYEKALTNRVDSLVFMIWDYYINDAVAYCEHELEADLITELLNNSNTTIWTGTCWMDKVDFEETENAIQTMSASPRK